MNALMNRLGFTAGSLHMLLALRSQMSTKQWLYAWPTVVSGIAYYVVTGREQQ